MKSIDDLLGDRIKEYEDQETSRRLMPGLPIIARMDGRAFHTFTRDLDRPFDRGLAGLMGATMMAMVHETNATLGYTQSDEISLVMMPTETAEPYFGRRVMKMVSQLAAQTTAVFAHLLPTWLPFKAAGRHVRNLPTFDARVFVVPSASEAANAILWREQDAVRNSIAAAAQSVHSHQELLGKPRVEQLQMLKAKGINWDDYSTVQKRGTFARRVYTERKLTDDELEDLPEKHFARLNPDLIVKRSSIQQLELPQLKTIANLPETLFEGATPIIRQVPGAQP